MMHCHIAVLFLRILKKRELSYPQELKVIFFQQIQLSCQLQTQVAQHVEYNLVLICCKEKEIARFSVHGSDQGNHFLFLHKLCKGRLKGAVLIDGNVCKTLCPKALCILYQSVDFLSRHMALALSIDTADRTAIFQSALKYHKFAVLHNLGNIL